MKAVYRSLDGLIFNTEEECLSHEKETPLFRMWDSSGETKLVECGYVVELNNNDAVEKFIELSQESGSEYCGIEGVGLYVWDEHNFKFVDISSYQLGALRAYFVSQELEGLT